MHTSSEKRASSATQGPTDPLLRKPGATDGARVWDLVAACPPLDRNSLYCNLLQCTDFADTSVLAERGDDAVGWISGYRPPNDPSTLFVWQVAVREEARGTGLAGKMLSALISRPGCEDVRYMKTTVTPDNDASRAMFRSFAKRANAPLRESAGFERDSHFRGRHDSERLITIGPIPQDSPARQSTSSAA